MYYHYQTGKYNKAECETVLPFNENMHANFTKATNKTLYFILLEKDCLNNYQINFRRDLKSGELSMDIRLALSPYEDIQSAQKSLYAFLQNTNDTRDIFLLNNVLFYKDKDNFYVGNPLFYHEQKEIYLTAISHDKISLSVDNSKHEHSYDGGSYSGGKPDSNIHRAALFDQCKLLNQSHPGLMAYLSPKDAFIILTDASKNIINIFKYDKRQAIPRSTYFTSIDANTNNTVLSGVTENTLIKIKFHIANHSNFNYPTITFTKHDFTNKHGLSLALSSHQDYYIGEHHIENEADIDKITSIGGRSIAQIERIMKTCSGRYSSGGFLHNHHDLLTVLKEDYRLLKQYNLTYKQIAALIYLIDEAYSQDEESIEINQQQYYMVGGIAYNPKELRWDHCIQWARGIGVVDSPFDDMHMSSHDIFISITKDIDNDKIDKLIRKGKLFGFASCLAPMIEKYGFFERGFYHFDITQFVKMFKLDATYKHCQNIAELKNYALFKANDNNDPVQLSTPVVTHKPISP